MANITTHHLIVALEDIESRILRGAAEDSDHANRAAITSELDDRATRTLASRAA